jgi:hypothetical protein
MGGREVLGVDKGVGAGGELHNVGRANVNLGMVWGGGGGVAGVAG